MESKVVAVIGASPNRDRYSNMAVRALLDRGYRVIPLHPSAETIEGLPTRRAVADIGPGIDTITVYVNPAIGIEMAEDIARLKPRRVILNPGAESDELAAKLGAVGVEVTCACTLVMLRTGTF